MDGGDTGLVGCRSHLSRVLSHDARTQIRRDVDAKSAREWNDQWKTAAGGQWIL